MRLPGKMNLASMALPSRRLHVPASFLLLLLSRLICPQALTAQQPGEQLYEVSASKYMLGTKIEVKALYADILECRAAFYDAFQEIQRVENLLSYSRENSEIAAINRTAGVAPVKVSQETFAIIRRAVDYAARFDGIFDVSIGPVTILWGFSDRIMSGFKILNPHYFFFQS